MATELGVPFLGRIPIYQPIREGSDAGVPLVISEPESPAARAFMAAAERTAAQVSIASYNRPDHSVDGGEVTIAMRSDGSRLGVVCSSCCRGGVQPAPADVSTPSRRRTMPCAIIDPYLKIQTALADDSIDDVAANAGKHRDGGDGARRAGDEDRHGRGAAGVGGRDRRTRARSSATLSEAIDHLHDGLAAHAARGRPASPSARWSQKPWLQKDGDASPNPYYGSDDADLRQLHEVNISFTQAHARQRPRRAPPRGSRVPDRRGEPLVSRRIEERAAGPHRVRAPVRAPDVRRVGAPRSRVLPAAAGRRRVAQRIDQRRSHQLLGSRADRARSSWRCGWNPIAWATCCRR